MAACPAPSSAARTRSLRLLPVTPLPRRRTAVISMCLVVPGWRGAGRRLPAAALQLLPGLRVLVAVLAAEHLRARPGPVTRAVTAAGSIISPAAAPAGRTADTGLLPRVPRGSRSISVNRSPRHAAQNIRYAHLATDPDFRTARQIEASVRAIDVGGLITDVTECGLLSGCARSCLLAAGLCFGLAAGGLRAGPGLAVVSGAAVFPCGGVWWPRAAQRP